MIGVKFIDCLTWTISVVDAYWTSYYVPCIPILGDSGIWEVPTMTRTSSKSLVSKQSATESGCRAKQLYRPRSCSHPWSCPQTCHRCHRRPWRLHSSGRFSTRPCTSQGVPVRLLGCRATGRVVNLMSTAYVQSWDGAEGMSHDFAGWLATKGHQQLQFHGQTIKFHPYLLMLIKLQHWGSRCSLTLQKSRQSWCFLPKVKGDWSEMH